MLDIFHTLAEVSVAVTGFSSLIIIFRGDQLPWSRQDYVSFSFILSWSIGSVFLSLLPILLVQFGLSVAAAAQVGLFSLIGFIFIAGGLLTTIQLRIVKETGETIGNKTRTMMGFLFLGLVVVSFTAGLNVLPGPIHAWYALTIVILMAGAIQNLLDFVVRSVRSRHND